jgi:hypothetical protein
MYRLLTITVTAVWIAAMTALVARDVWPAWTAQDPPRLTLAPDAPEQLSQCGIFDARGHRIGTAWSAIRPFGKNVRLQGTILLERVAMLPPVRVETLLTIMADGMVDEFELDVHGLNDLFGKPLPVEIRGENYGRYIPCTLRVGTFRRTLKLDAAASRLIGDSIRPFDRLPDLQVGQSWRMQIVDPISAALNRRTRVLPVIAKVVGKETIDHHGDAVECFVVEAGRSKAWVRRDGLVMKQTVELPGLGRLTVRDEPYDEEARNVARERVPPTKLR